MSGRLEFADVVYQMYQQRRQGRHVDTLFTEFLIWQKVALAASGCSSRVAS